MVPANTEDFWSYGYIIGALVVIFIARLKRKHDYEEEMKLKAGQCRSDAETLPESQQGPAAGSENKNKV